MQDPRLQPQPLLVLVTAWQGARPSSTDTPGVWVEARPAGVTWATQSDGATGGSWKEQG